MWCMWKTCFLCFKIKYFNYLYFHSMSWLVCWVVSDFLRQNDLKDGKGNIHKWKESTKRSFCRIWHPRDRMDDAIACQARINSDAAAWLTRPRALSRTHMTQSHDWRDRVARKCSEWRDRVTHADAWQRPRTRNCRKRFHRFLKPFLAQIQVQKAYTRGNKVWERIHLGGARQFSYFPCFRSSFERGSLLSLSLVGFRTFLCFRSNSQSQVLYFYLFFQFSLWTRHVR